jgi:hypothetical protein
MRARHPVRHAFSVNLDMQAARRSILNQASEDRQRGSLVEAISRDVWLFHGKGGTLDWVDVDRYLEQLVEDVRGRSQALRNDSCADRSIKPKHRTQEVGGDSGTRQTNGGRL